MNGARLALAAVLLLAGACVDSEVRMIGPARPSRPAGCNVTFLPDIRVVDLVDVATASVSCARSRDRCLNQLRDQACAVGADSIFLLSETTEAMYIHITARFAAHQR